ncbi:PREDICTED: RNA-binding protein Nova-2-like [Eufriesea mexicana]|uniref:RNA-binding protein Nova-2-like n=1 Tax=Eufriesea mexicana TaxID=516756 RepID=UPI00083C3C70|nr:PREDICTED: RNA-binding protein Nova-2-like [Eufriesea mexicana]
MDVSEHSRYTPFRISLAEASLDNYCINGNDMTEPRAVAKEVDMSEQSKQTLFRTNLEEANLADYCIDDDDVDDREERFSTKESATHAIVAVHNTDINGQTVKCSWGKESGDPNNAQQTGQALSSATYPYYAAAAAAAAAAAGVAGVGGVGGVGGAGQLGYWYPPQSYPTTATQMQAGGFLQGMQGYTYGQFAGYQQAQYMGMGMGVHAAGTAAGWGQGLPGGPQLPPHHATTVTAPPGVQAAPPPPPPPAQMMAYPMQQFQLADEDWLTPSLLV